ncbi:enoyl-CoA hydratase/isomerase family protein [Shinella sp. NM-101]|uniref:enoyl-CoA hydratase/isomerase family protein n=1 Tax=Shinella sp. NM-101 TaxID=2744455 RepID=UPI001F2F91DB|nr:enoyl-CoA hydratase-related protein [Shinella sp. NM-101]
MSTHNAIDRDKFQMLRVEEHNPHLLVVTFNRPHVANAVNTETGQELIDLFSALQHDPGNYRAVVLTGAGERHFCAGADLKQRKDMTTEAWRAQHAVFESMRQALLNCPIPLIGAVNGAAYAGGCEMVLCCDFAYASPNARFALTEVKIGVMPGGSGTQTMPRAVGERRAKEFIFSAVPISAETALQWGLVNRIVPAEELLAQTSAVAERICANAPLSIRQAKKSIHFGMQADLRTGMAFEIEAYNRLVDTADRVEGVNAFNEGRTPVFQGK